MGLKLGVLGVAAALAVCGQALAASPVGIQIVTGTLDFGAADGSEERDASLKILENFPAAPALIYLDLNIAPAVADPNAAEKVLDFGVILYGGDGQPLAAVPCALGGSQMIDRGNRGISIQAGAIYPHIVLEAEFAAPEHAPYNALSCDYAPGLPGEVSLRLTGFFVVQDTMIPTARGVRLVPFIPPMQEALDALAKSHADP
ncbi:MAG: hypothetical protein QM698_10580 [Micropepsaceae bacterium]